MNTTAISENGVTVNNAVNAGLNAPTSTWHNFGIHMRPAHIGLCN